MISGSISTGVSGSYTVTLSGANGFTSDTIYLAPEEFVKYSALIEIRDNLRKLIK